jgi:hypothetical protein
MEWILFLHSFSFRYFCCRKFQNNVILLSWPRYPPNWICLLKIHISKSRTYVFFFLGLDIQEGEGGYSYLFFIFQNSKSDMIYCLKYTINMCWVNKIFLMLWCAPNNLVIGVGSFVYFLFSCKFLITLVFDYELNLRDSMSSNLHWFGGLDILHSM